MNSSPTTTNLSRDDVRQMLIRDLVDSFPAVMPVLTPFGIDLCCGGGRPLGEALELHGAPVDETLSTIEAIITVQAETASK